MNEIMSNQGTTAAKSEVLVALDKLKWLAVGLGIFLMDQILPSLPLFIDPKRGYSNPLIAITSTLLAIGVAVFAWFAMSWMGQPLSLKAYKSKLFPYYLIGFPVIMAVNITGSLIAGLIRDNATSENQEAIQNWNIPFYLLFVTTVIMAPIVEEIFFRLCLQEQVLGQGRAKWLGWLFIPLLVPLWRLLGAHVPSGRDWLLALVAGIVLAALAILIEKFAGSKALEWLGWIGISLLFGYMHLSTDVTNFGFWITYAGIGAVLGFVAKSSKKTEYSIAIHMMMNAYVTFGMLITQLLV